MTHDAADDAAGDAADDAADVAADDAADAAPKYNPVSREALPAGLWSLYGGFAGLARARRPSTILVERLLQSPISTGVKR